MLGIVLHLPGLQPGLPASILTLLAAAAVLPAATGAWALRTQTNPATALRRLFALNGAYLSLTAGVLLWHHTSLTMLGYAYFLGESALILALMRVEQQTATTLENTPLQQ